MSMVEGATRVDLQGQPAGVVTAEEAARAQQRLAERLKPYDSLPRKGHRVGLRIDFFEAYSAFTRVTACTLALSPYIVTR
jgi:hypothetical protein